jgi:hypothetical protein
MALMLTTHDTGFENPDDSTIVRVLASLDGVRNLIATLAHSDERFLQASGSARGGFVLTLQEGSLDRHYRSKDSALPLDRVVKVFQQYARGDLSWRDSIEWVKEEFQRPRPSFFNTWAGFIVALLAVALLVWLLGVRS